MTYSSNTPLFSFIDGLPKAELHVHLEGTFEPELMFELARRNELQISYNSIEELKEAYHFTNLQDFLNIYYTGAEVLIYEQDFFDLTYAYLTKVHEQNVVHVEVFFDPQTHTDRGIPFETVIKGIKRALDEGEKTFGITYKIIMSFLRHLSEEAAFVTLQQSLPYKDWIIAVGLDSSEKGNPPSKFQRVFEAARKEGYLTVAHAGEEGPPAYIREALDMLKVSRIDHGNACLQDDALVEDLVRRRMPLTLCPLSNLELKVISDMRNYPLKEMLAKGLMVTINSDDPAYFGGYMNENFVAVAEALHLSLSEIVTLIKNGFNASFLTDVEKTHHMHQIDAYLASAR